MNKKISLTTTIFLVIISIVLTFFTTLTILNSKMQNYNKLVKSNENVINKLVSIDNIVKNNFIGDISDEKLTDSILSGYMDGISDKYSMYINKENYAAMMKSLEGNFEGIGVTVDLANNKNGIPITYVMSNSPAEKAGLVVADIIIKINGKAVEEIGIYAAYNEMLGQEGSVANFTIVRDNQEIEISITRAIFEKTTVFPLKIINDDIGFIRIAEFNSKTAELFKAELARAKELNLKGLIFDVRNNPGGEIGSITACLDMLMPKGNLVTLKYKDGLLDKDGKQMQPTVMTTEGKNELSIPAIVLVNENTASAAELFACDLKDAKKAVLVGAKTYGKQVGQTTFKISDTTAINLTTFNYLPLGEEIFNEVGIVPAHEVLLDKSKTTRLYSLPVAEDTQLVKAVELLSKDIIK